MSRALAVNVSRICGLMSRDSFITLEAGGKPSTWFPPEGLVEHICSNRYSEYLIQRRMQYKAEPALQPLRPRGVPGHAGGRTTNCKVLQGGKGSPVGGGPSTTPPTPTTPPSQSTSRKRKDRSRSLSLSLSPFFSPSFSLSLSLPLSPGTPEGKGAAPGVSPSTTPTTPPSRST